MFTVRVGDGQSSVDVRVTVPIAPADLTSTPITVGDYPYRVVVAGDHVFVGSVGGTSVSVIDSRTNTFVKQIDVVGSPLGLAAKPDGSRVYVSNHANGDFVTNTVSVIDTTTQTVIATITIPDRDGHNYGSYLAVSPDGSRLYVANRADQTVSVVNTADNTLISTTNVGYWGGDDIEVSPDGTRLYLAGDAYGDIRVINTTTMTVVGTVDVLNADASSSIAFSPNGKRAYAVAVLVTEGGSYSSLAVIDTDPDSDHYNTQITTISSPYGQSGWGFVWNDVALSPDGSRAYVTWADGKTIDVIDTTTNSLVSRFTTDGVGDDEYGYQFRYIAVEPDNGTLYVTDGSDGRVFAVTVGDGPLIL